MSKGFIRIVEYKCHFYQRLEPAKRGRLKRPRLQQTPDTEPRDSSPVFNEEKEVDVGGSLGEEAQDKEGAGAREDTSQGDSGMLAEGHTILELIPASRTSNNENKMGTLGGGGEEGDRGEKGYVQNKLGGKQQWDPGSSKEA